MRHCPILRLVRNKNARIYSVEAATVSQYLSAKVTQIRAFDDPILLLCLSLVEPLTANHPLS